MPQGSLTDSLAETLGLFGGAGEPRTTTEIADELDLGRRSTYDRLDRLVDRDRLATKKVGANARVWWRPTGASAGETTPVAERERRGDREEYEALVDAVEHAIGTFDPEGNVRTWNPGAESITGYAAADVRGEHVSTFYTEEDRAAGVPEENFAAAAREGSIETEGWRVRADGTRFWASVTLTAMRTDDGDLRGFAAVTRDETEQRKQEKRLERERRLTDQILETAPVRLAVYDADGRTERVNSRAREELGLEAGAEDCFGERGLRDEDGNELSAAASPVRRVIETGEPVEDVVVQGETPAGERRWASLTASPLFDEDGDLERVILAGTDVTAQKRTERRLKRQRDELEAELDDVFTRIDDAVYALDDDWRFTYLNARAEELLETAAEELLGVSVWEAFPNAREGAYREQFERAMATQEPVVFEEYSSTAGAPIEVTAYPSENGLSVYFRDVSERKRRERELERYETIVETLWDGVYALGPDENFVMANDAFLELSGYDREELLGEPGRLVHDEQVNAAADDAAAAVAAGDLDGAVLEFDLVRADGDTVPVESRFGPYEYDDEAWGRCGVVRDVTARKEYERYLEAAKGQLEAATEAGAVGTFEWHVQEDRMVAGPAFAKTFGIDPAVAREGVSLERYFERIHPNDRDRIERALEGALAEGGDYEEEYRVRNADDEYRWIVARGHVVCDDEGRPDTFPGALTDITARKEAELELERQRGRLAALNNLNKVVREITDAILEQSSREEIEATVCDHLADSDSYTFAWIGEADAASRAVEVRSRAGVDRSADATPTIDPADSGRTGPTAQALRTGNLQVTHDGDPDHDHDPGREHDDAADVRSVAAIPVAHDDTVYGVLTVHAERPAAFTGEERTVIAQLGEIVGHAIAATERKRALMSDELVELEFRIEDVLAAVGVDAEAEGQIALEHTVSLGDDEFLVYGTATAAALPALEALAESRPHWELVGYDGDADPATFELRLHDPPVLSAVASLGGSVETAAFEDGDYRMRLHLAPGVEVRRVIDAVEAAYPAAEMVRRRQVTRTVADRGRRPRDLVADLTERQRTALEAAFHTGFFEWPRDASGEDVAASIGVAPPTFHQHLRKAQRKVVDGILTPVADERATAATGDPDDGRDGSSG